MNRWSLVAEIVAVALITVAVWGLAGPFWALLPVAAYLLFLSFSLDRGGPKE